MGIKTAVRDPSAVPLPGEKLIGEDEELYLSMIEAREPAKDIFGRLMKGSARLGVFKEAIEDSPSSPIRCRWASLPLYISSFCDLKLNQSTTSVSELRYIDDHWS